MSIPYGTEERRVDISAREMEAAGAKEVMWLWDSTAALAEAGAWPDVSNSQQDYCSSKGAAKGLK